MTYLSFIIIFLLIPLVSLILCLKFLLEQYKLPTTSILILSLIALLYTIPWDNYLIVEGIWFYDNNRISNLILSIPIEECGFMILQTSLSVIIFDLFLKKTSKRSLNFKEQGFLLACPILLIGMYLLFFKSARYTSLILLWSFLPVCLQWSLGFESILENFKKIAVPFCLITVYYCIIDHFAISQGIWTISESTSLGITLFNLPLEEALFFFFTNLFIAQAVILLKPRFGKNAF